MHPHHFVIAIDGPAASGKSTTARRTARELGFLHLDTGAMYRAFTLKVIRAGIDPGDPAAVGRLVGLTHIELRRPDGGLQVLLDGEDVSQAIRGAEVTAAVSRVSSLRAVRDAMVREQRRAADQWDVVAEGRDIGTVVFPNADLKFFMVAGIDARARRRQAELRIAGMEMDLADVAAAIDERDRLDSTREESPLRRAPDAIEVDTSDMTIEEQVAYVTRIARQRLTGGRGG
ncbi:MAG TPA: (d)CMP kinase [Bacteroidota bacterium]